MRALKGCHSQGETREEALKNIQEATKLYLEVANEKALHWGLTGLGRYCGHFLKSKSKKG